MYSNNYRALSRENLTLLKATNKGKDQPAHPCSLINAIVFHPIQSIISKLASCQISIFYLVSEAEQTGLSLTLSETPKTLLGFLATRPNIRGQ